MKALLLLACVLLISGCATRSRERQFVGTWSMRDSVYFLRIYEDGKVAQWPSPPDGETAWTRLHGNTLDFGCKPPLQNPRILRRGRLLVMEDNVKERMFENVSPDLTPPQTTRHDETGN